VLTNLLKKGNGKMEILFDEPREQTPIVTIGDIVKMEGTFYICIQFDMAVSLRSLCGLAGAIGSYLTLEELTDSLQRFDYEIFPASEYELNLVTKQAGTRGVYPSSQIQE